MDPSTLPNEAVPFDPRVWDPFARLLERRIVFLRGPIEDTKADQLAAQLLVLDAESDDPVTMYIDSPGGSAAGMFALYDTMQLLRSPVHTTCVGIAASAGAFLLATGSGTRSATPNARVMLHQPLGGAEGTAADIQIQAREFAFLRERMEQILSERTGKSVERIHLDTQRDFWLSAHEALRYGLIDEVAVGPRAPGPSRPRPVPPPGS
ncbi:ATP-dependent Clp endopeptidase proteolytic subunit ClpP [soil metagenome]|jgi:ATP-dependent Clp protease protease subunit|nr:ATP-dependent Clp protease proteolytic subunit [Euzebyaceae bacterium]